jgi:hypothetical protein
MNAYVHNDMSFMFKLRTVLFFPLFLLYSQHRHRHTIEEKIITDILKSFRYSTQSVLTVHSMCN